MRRIQLMLLLLVGASATAFAQSDDMYFVPKKVKKVPVAQVDALYDRPAYYVGSDRDVDEYNRRRRFRSSYQTIGADSLQNDVIDFAAGDGVYPDSLGLDSTVTTRRVKRARLDVDEEDDYRYCRRMQMFDGWYDPWFYGYSTFYGPYWRAGWYDPWMYGYAGWYGPWGWNYYGYGWPYYSSAWYWGGYPHVWGYPYGWARPVMAYRSGHTGTLGYYDRSHYVGGTRRNDNRGRYRGSSASRTYGDTNANTRFGTRRNDNAFGQNNAFGTVRQSAPSFGGGRPGGSFGGGSFGGGRPSGVGGGGVRMGRR